MRIHHFLLSMVLFGLALPAEAAEISLSITVPALSREYRQRLESSRPELRSLLGEDVRFKGEAAEAGAWTVTAESASGWSAALGAEARAAKLSALKGEWGDAMTIREGGRAFVPPSRAAEVPERGADIPAAELSASFKEKISVGVTWKEQTTRYDGGTGGSGDAKVVDARPYRASGARTTRSKAKGLATGVPPAPVKAPRGTEKKISWARAGLEALKGGGEMIRDMVSWKGLAVAAGAVALTIVFPPAVYGLLAVGAGVGGWQMGKSLVGGVDAYKRGDAEDFYKNARLFGKGTLTAGLSIYGAKFAPTQLKPHVPHGWQDWKAPIASIDNLGLLLNSLWRGGQKPSHP